LNLMLNQVAVELEHLRRTGAPGEACAPAVVSSRALRRTADASENQRRQDASQTLGVSHVCRSRNL